MKKNYFYFGILTFTIWLFVHLHWKVIHEELNGIHLSRQTETQTNIQNFYRYDFNILNPSCNIYNGNKGNVRRLEFPIMQWMIANTYFVFGDHIVVTRFCMIFFAILGFIGIYKLFYLLVQNAAVAMMGSALFLFSPLYYFYAINPMPDVFSLVSAIWFLYYFLLYVKYKQNSKLCISALFIGLSILAKLPFILYFVVVVIYASSIILHSYRSGESHITEFKKLILVFSIALLPPILWYSWVMPTWGTDTVIGGIFNGHFSIEKSKEIMKYHREILLSQYLFNKVSIIFFYMSALCILLGKGYKSNYFLPSAGLGIVCLLYFFYELNIIDTIHDYYMLPFLVPVYLVTLYGINFLYKWHKYAAYAIIFAVTLVPKETMESTKSWWTLEKIGIPADWLKYKDELRAAAPDDKMCAMLNDDSGYILPYLMNKQGYCFQGDNLPMLWIDDMVRNWKVVYLYSNSRKVDTDTAFAKFVDHMVLEKGTMRVFKLRLPK